MSTRHKVLLTLKLLSLVDKKPKFIIKNNDDLVEFTQTDLSATCEFEANFGHNKIEILLLNKDPNDTKVNEHGEIIEDLAVIIEKFMIDDLDFTDKFRSDCMYLCGNEQLKTFGFMSKNGRLLFDYVCPGYYFQRQYQYFQFSIFK